MARALGPMAKPMTDAVGSNRLLIVIPLYNEAAKVGSVLGGLREVTGADILVVDDGSNDGSLVAAQASGLHLPHLIRHRRNQGYGAALQSGFDFALRYGYDVVITFDADGQHRPADMVRLLEAAASADIISGSRFHPESTWIGTPPPQRLLANQKLAELVRQHTGYEITDSACGLKLYQATTLAQLDITEPGYMMPYQLWGQAARAGLTVHEVPVAMIYQESDDVQDWEPELLDRMVSGCQQVLGCALSPSPWRSALTHWRARWTAGNRRYRIVCGNRVGRESHR